MRVSRSSLIPAAFCLSLGARLCLAGEYAADPCPPPTTAAPGASSEYARLAAETSTLDTSGAAFDAKCQPIHPAGSPVVAQCRVEKVSLEGQIKAHDAQVLLFNQSLAVQEEQGIQTSEHKLADYRQKMQALLRTNRDMGRDIDEWSQMNTEAQNEARMTAFFGAIEVAGEGMKAGAKAAEQLTGAQLQSVQAWYDQVQTTLPEWIRADVAARITRAHTLSAVGELIAYLGQQGGRGAALVGPLQQEHFAVALGQATKGILALSLTIMETEPEVRVGLVTAEIFLDDTYAGWAQHLALARLDDFTAVIGDNARAMDSLSKAYKREVDRRSAAQRAAVTLKGSACFSP